MRSKDEIREEIKNLKEELKEQDDINSYYSGYIGGSITILEWVLEDTECQK